MVRRRKYTEEQLVELVARSRSVAEVLRRLGINQAGGTHAHISRMIKQFGIDTSHFVRHQNGSAKVRLRPEEILVRQPPGSPRRKPHLLHRALLEEGRPYQCVLCGCPGSWRGRPLRLEVDHRDGDYHNNEAWNLRFLCPNCHTQTDNFSGRSRNKYVEADGQLTLFGALQSQLPPGS